MARSSRPTGPDLRRAGGPLTLGALALAGTALLAVVDPNRGHFPLCPTKYFTGLDCPFCGGLRAVHSLTHGHLLAALHHNALLLIGAPFAIWWWVGWLRRDLVAQPAPIRSQRRTRLVTSCFLALAVAFMVVRNLPIGAALAASSAH